MTDDTELKWVGGEREGEIQGEKDPRKMANVSIVLGLKKNWTTRFHGV